MRIAFLGTPPFAVPSLRSLAASYDVVGVVTQPDRPAGRGRRLLAPAVKQASLELGLRVFQPEKVRAPEAVVEIANWSPDVIVVAAFGQILPRAVLELPPKGCLNVHPSLLPRWRGASPIQAALRHGDNETGVTIMRMDEGLDSGPILAQRTLQIRPDHTGGTLGSELAELGAGLLIETLPGYLAGDRVASPQDDRQATLAPRLTRRDGRLDPQHPAADLHRMVRAFSPWPGTFLARDDQVVNVLGAHAEEGEVDLPPGTLGERAGHPALATSAGWLILDLLQEPGRRPVDGPSFLRGRRSLLGRRFT